MELPTVNTSFTDTPLRVFALGSMSPLAQVVRVRAGLAAQRGVEVVEHFEDADVVYCNDPGSYDEALEARRDGRLPKGCKLVFNVLDVPEHLLPPNGDYTHEKLLALRENLAKADAITAISPFTRSQLHRLLGLSAIVVWNPIKDVTPEKRLSGVRPYPFRVLLAGRCRDRNKRQDTLGVPALIMAGFEESEVAVVGGEWPGWGTNLGIVDDDTLNDLYNSVDYVVHPSLNEGLGLSPIEGMACGAIPILTYDCSTFRDIPFFPQYWGCYPSPTSIAMRLLSLENNPGIKLAEQQHCLESSDGIVDQFGKDAVARRLVEVFKKVKQN